MLKNRRIELQAKTIRRLQDDVTRLSAENKELKEKLRQQTRLVEAAEKYRDEHNKAIASLASAKERYDRAVKDMVDTKKRYVKEFGECIREIG